MFLAALWKLVLTVYNVFFMGTSFKNAMGVFGFSIEIKLKDMVCFDFLKSWYYF